VQGIERKGVRSEICGHIHPKHKAWEIEIPPILTQHEGGASHGTGPCQKIHDLALAGDRNTMLGGGENALCPEGIKLPEGLNFRDRAGCQGRGEGGT